jgi:uncharacterized protein YneF (UPF0154 family)
MPWWVWVIVVVVCYFALIVVIGKYLRRKWRR